MLWCGLVKLARVRLVPTLALFAAVFIAMLACSGSNDQPPAPPCGAADTQALQATLAQLSPACRIDLSHSADCVAPQYKECNGFCSGNEVLFCGKPEGECSGFFGDDALDGLLRSSSTVRIEHPFQDGREFTSFEMESEGAAMMLESLLRQFGCATECRTEVALRRGRVVVTWPRWKDEQDPEPPCRAEVKALLAAKWATATAARASGP
jgi:hypothetical protein